MLDYILIKSPASTARSPAATRRAPPQWSTACWSPASPRSIVAVVFLFGGMISDVFNETCSTIQAEGAAGTGTCLHPVTKGFNKARWSCCTLHRVRPFLVTDPDRFAREAPHVGVGMNVRSRIDEDGASAVEYGLLVAGVAALIIAVVFLFGGAVADLFDNTCDSFGSRLGRLDELRQRPEILLYKLLRYHERRVAERLLSGRA